MYLLVIRDTKLNVSNGPKDTLLQGTVLFLASDCPEDEVVARQVELAIGEPAPFSIADGFDYAFPRQVHANILEYTTWDALQAAARMCR